MVAVACFDLVHLQTVLLDLHWSQVRRFKRKVNRREVQRYLSARDGRGTDRLGLVPGRRLFDRGTGIRYERF